MAFELEFLLGIPSCASSGCKIDRTFDPGSHDSHVTGTFEITVFTGLPVRCEPRTYHLVLTFNGAGRLGTRNCEYSRPAKIIFCLLWRDNARARAARAIRSFEPEVCETTL